MKATIIREPDLSPDEHRMVDEFEVALGQFLSEFNVDSSIDSTDEPEFYIEADEDEI